MLGVLALLSFVAAFAVLQVLLSRFGGLALDHPNPRSLHERPVPRTGGIAVMLAVLISLVFGAAGLWLLVALALLLAAVSFVDDVRHVPTPVRLALHLAAAAAIVGVLLVPIGWPEAVLFTLAVAWVANLFNFMDGSDGLAGGMAFIGFSAYALAAHAAGHAALAATSVALAAGAGAFLVFNFHPARIFLGDVGSVPLGFLAASLGLLGWRDQAWPLWFPLLVFAVFIGDATLTLLKRLIQRERVWQAHRTHYYQRLNQLGAGHRGTALGAYALMLGCSAAALYARQENATVQATAAAAAILPMLAAAAWIDIQWARRSRPGQAPR